MTPLIAIVFAAFVSLGLPDAVMGAAWPAIAGTLGADEAAAGLLSIVTLVGTITSSFASGSVLRKFGTFTVVTASTALTAVALVGFALAPSFAWLVLLSLPLGLGGGAIDAALNSYAALNFTPSHVNFLHASWGLGALIGPLVVGFWLNSVGDWRPAYWAIAAGQLAIAVLLMVTKRLWVAPVESTNDDVDPASAPDLVPFWRIPGFPTALGSFFLYCGAEMSAMLWSATYLVAAHGLSADFAAAGASAVYIGLTASRVFAGFIAPRVSNQFFLFGYAAIMVAGATLVFVPGSAVFSLVGLAVFGFGCGPIYPTTISETARRFGAHNTERLMGIQMGLAYLGMASVPPLVGLLITRVDPGLFPVVLLAMTLGMLGAMAALERMVRRRERAER